MILFQLTRKGVSTAFAVYAISCFATAAWAYTPGACREDGAKLCPGITNDKELIPCLKKNEAQLSTGCKVNLAEAREMVRDLRDACQADVEKHCADIKTGQGRIRRCLRQHEAELTPGCKEQIGVARRKYRIEGSTTTAAPATPPADQPDQPGSNTSK